MTQQPLQQYAVPSAPWQQPQWGPASGQPSLIAPGEAAAPALHPEINPATGATNFPTESLGVQPPFFAPQEPDSLARTMEAFVEKGHKLYRQTFEAQPEYKMFWNMPARQRFALYLAHEPVTPWFMTLAHIDAPETAKRIRDYASLQKDYGVKQ